MREGEGGRDVVDIRSCDRGEERGDREEERVCVHLAEKHYT